ncbi:hypothetical protein KJ707_00030 [Patescibacteria group bacterium]|nr:hypothetical protein [Patescibacteria group bacterium]MBU1967204.1 hypothetical protein [Patescibacteria group bacterium]MBU2542945.1 hypothetical protein [Patescibacteria group bacterium]
MKKWVIILGPLFIFQACKLAPLDRLVPLARADRLESDSYVIQFGNFNIGSGGGDTTNYGLTYTIGQTAPGPFGQYGTSSYFIGSGFQYIYQIHTFGFTIDNTAIDLGELTVGVHNTASNKLSITTRGAGGYTIYAYEQTPLTRSNGTDTIPDTTCNAGTCSEAIAGVWTNQNIPGFGFNVVGADTAADFLDSTYFRQFANDSAAEDMQVIMSNTNIVRNSQGTVTYKAGITGSVAAGNYQTGVVYVAVPGY